MFELIFVLVFMATLLVTGMTLVSVLGAIALAFVVMLALGMVGIFIKLIPWLIVIGVGYWFFKNVVYQPR
ncbi:MULTISPECIES: envelope stress response protein PspG [unclassified Vibrio]|uniref:envelope stress response protein PspG n=1 Tax=unclassified Vibrio TaxID=2614977 RepID=UPI001361AD13|nr:MULTISPECIES: envelope stress response protein PspG [unclassified Vibrio]NAW57391.1 envelope stress response protein PspG [Vibrio sp. V36_P2S2PM302]NAX28215.1 envelope stress response protein PspG [Vibrio sp. V38_P2S17PM301]NAX29056.1 envelope stress response protein PspG [Vibrio sp. V37_P2S8PM304]